MSDSRRKAESEEAAEPEAAEAVAEHDAEPAPEAAEAVAEHDHATDPVVIAGPDAYQPLVIEPAPEVEPSPEETRPQLPPGTYRVTYVGSSDRADYGEYTFRPGQPVIVPSEVAEELLTWPFERFEVVEE